VNTPLSKEQVDRLRKVFRMPAVQSMKSRKTTITNAFVSAIIPVEPPTPEDIAEALLVLGMTAESVVCSYCGDKCNAWDHLRPLVVGRRPTGYISEIANLVPACSPCNSSKTNKHWRDWMTGKAPQSPTSRAIQNLQIRIERLEAFECWRKPTKVDFAAIIGEQEFEAYWQELDRIIGEMECGHAKSKEISIKIANAREQWRVRPQVSEKQLNDGSPAA
jgi:HNH endonuclease